MKEKIKNKDRLLASDRIQLVPGIWDIELQDYKENEYGSYIGDFGEIKVTMKDGELSYRESYELAIVLEVKWLNSYWEDTSD